MSKLPSNEAEDLHYYLDVSFADLPENLKNYAPTGWDYLPESIRERTIGENEMEAGFNAAGDIKAYRAATKLKVTEAKLNVTEAKVKKTNEQQSQKARLKRGLKNDDGVTLDDLIHETAKQYPCESPSEAWTHFINKVHGWAESHTENSDTKGNPTCHYELYGKTRTIAYKTFAEKLKAAKNTL